VRTRARLDVALGLGLVLAGAAGCGARPAAPAAAVRTGTVRVGALEDRFTLTGELAAVRSDILRVPRTPTWMITIKWMVEEGATVKAGDRVVEFDTSSLAGSLADRRLALQRAQSELVSENARTTAAELDKRMEVDRKRAALDKARAEAAVPADLRTRREHQEKLLAVAKETDALAKAEDELAAAQRTARLDRRIKEIALAKATRELTELESRLDELTLKAPRDGLVQVSMNYRGEARKYQIGDSAYAGMDVATMPDLSVMQVRARVYDVDEGAVKVGMKAECVLDAYPDRPVSGVVETVTPIARPEGRDAVRRVFDVTVKLDRTDPEIMLPGMSVRVEVIRRQVERGLLAPREALGREADGQGQTGVNVDVQAGVHAKTYARLADGKRVPVEIEVCGLFECALRAGPPEGTVLAVGPEDRP
jgi:multidrug efflux pump subunit AcrA (membrane-fusion protein)